MFIDEICSRIVYIRIYLLYRFAHAFVVRLIAIHLVETVKQVEKMVGASCSAQLHGTLVSRY